MNQYTLKKKDTAIVISPDEEFTGWLEYLNPANNVYYELAVDRGEMSIADFTRLRLGKFSPKEAFKVGDKLFVGLGLTSKGLLSVFDKDKQSKEINFFGNYPVAGTEYQYQEYLDYFQGHLAGTRQPVHIRQHLFRLYRFLFLRKRTPDQTMGKANVRLPVPKGKQPHRIRQPSPRGIPDASQPEKNISTPSASTCRKTDERKRNISIRQSGKLLSCLRIKTPSSTW